MPASRRPSLWLSILAAGFLYAVIVLLTLCVSAFADTAPWFHHIIGLILAFPATLLLGSLNESLNSQLYLELLMFSCAPVLNALFWAFTLGPGYYWLRRRRLARRLAAEPACDGNSPATRYQFALRHLLIAVAVFAILLGACRAFYLNYLWGHLVTQHEELEKHLGQRVALTGTYHRIHSKDQDGYVAFQGCKIAIYCGCPEPPDGASVAMAGTLHRGRLEYEFAFYSVCWSK